MRGVEAKIFVLKTIVVLLSFGMGACKKEIASNEAKIKPPVRIYVVTARIDKKGTNSDSEGTAVLKGTYDEDSKMLSYTVTYENLVPQLITLRSGAKGTTGTLVRELFKEGGLQPVPSTVTGALLLKPLQERNLLKGLWFVAINTIIMTPEISGVLTLKQQ